MDMKKIAIIEIAKVTNLVNLYFLSKKINANEDSKIKKNEVLPPDKKTKISTKKMIEKKNNINDFL